MNNVTSHQWTTFLARASDHGLKLHSARSSWNLWSYEKLIGVQSKTSRYPLTCSAQTGGDLWATNKKLHPWPKHQIFRCSRMDRLLLHWSTARWFPEHGNSECPWLISELLVGSATHYVGLITQHNPCQSAWPSICHKHQQHTTLLACWWVRRCLGSATLYFRVSSPYEWSHSAG